MRVLFLIPKNNPPQLTGNYTKPFKEFIEACLNKDPDNVSKHDSKMILRHIIINDAMLPNYLIHLNYRGLLPKNCFDILLSRKGSATII